MIINRVHIEKFRGFQNSEFKLGEFITLIAGQNGTQKSTLLGILSQTFSIPTQDHPFSDEKPLTGGNYRSSFQEKFRLSARLDLPGSHEWTLFFSDKSLHDDIDEDGGFTIESISRGSNTKSIRFWQKGNRDAGSGYIQLPVLYLSLKRLIPLAEAGKITERDIALTDSEQRWFKKHYRKILINRDNLSSLDYLEGRSKNTLGVSTEHYDWESNSAGQDNLSKILLAVISFQRLKAKYPDDYKGGILAIDEIDATLYPGSQVQLLELLGSVCRKEKIQIIATTHSLHLLERMAELKNARGREQQFNTVYLTKQDNSIVIEEAPDFQTILHNLNVSMGKATPSPKLPVYTEDRECIHFVKALVKGQKYNLDFIDVKLGCNNYLEMGRKKVPSFSYPNSLVVLDGDTRNKMPKGRGKLKNFICLPGQFNPETLLAEFLNDLPDAHQFWKEKKRDYSHQVCFKTYDLEDIKSNRDNAKRWYNQQLDSGAWGREANNLFKYFLATIEEDKQLFLEEFKNAYEDMLP